MFRFCGKLMDAVKEEATANGEQQQVVSQEVESGPDKWPGKDHMTATINDLKKQLERVAQEKKDSLAAAEKKKLEDEQNWKGLADRAEKERDALKAGYEKQLKEMKIRVGLAGMNELAIDGVILRCPEDADVDTYIGEIKEKYADMINPVNLTQNERRANQGVKVSNDTSDFAAIKVLFEKARNRPGSVPQKEMIDGLQKLREYEKATGKKPPGFEDYGLTLNG